MYATAAITPSATANRNCGGAEAMSQATPFSADPASRAAFLAVFFTADVFGVVLDVNGAGDYQWPPLGAAIQETAHCGAHNSLDLGPLYRLLQRPVKDGNQRVFSFA